MVNSMRFCKYCGKQISEQDRICPACGKDLNPMKSSLPAPGPDTEQGVPESESASAPVSAIGAESRVPEGIAQKAGGLFSGNRKGIVAGAAAAVLLLVIMAVLSGRCRTEGCKNRKAPGSDYCYNHKCDVNGCRKERFAASNYCYEHYKMYDKDAESEENPAYSWLLDISDVLVYSEYGFTYAEGTLTNNNDTSVKYVKLKGAFKSRTGKVIDTDWTYAVGSEGLEPGESCKWKMSVTKDSSITDCDVTILDND